jgi:hypothetical protein
MNSTSTFLPHQNVEAYLKHYDKNIWQGDLKNNGTRFF